MDDLDVTNNTMGQKMNRRPEITLTIPLTRRGSIARVVCVGRLHTFNLKYGPLRWHKNRFKSLTGDKKHNGS